MKVSLESVFQRPENAEEWSPSVVSVDDTDEEFVAYYDRHPERVEKLSPRSHAILETMRRNARQAK